MLTCCKQGRVVQKPVKAKPGLKVNRSINFPSCHTAVSEPEASEGSGSSLNLNSVCKYKLGFYTSCSATFWQFLAFRATYGLEHFFGNLWSSEHFFGNFFQCEKKYPFLVTKICFLCISSLTKQINIHVNSIVRLY